jgi:hypothetical protein
VQSGTCAAGENDSFESRFRHAPVPSFRGPTVYRERVIVGEPDSPHRPIHCYT